MQMRTPYRFLVLPFVLITTLAVFGCDGGPSSSSPNDDGDVTLDFGGNYDGTEVVLERLVTDTPEGRVEIDLVALRVESNAADGTVEIDVAMRNRGNRAAGLPAYVFVGDFAPSGTAVINADNQLIDPAPGTILPEGPYPDWFDYAWTFGNDGILAVGETSEPRTWIIRVEGGGSFAFGAAVQVGLDVDRPTVSGSVFLDENANGQFDDNELPFGVGAVVLTGPDGSRQRAPVGDDGTWRLTVQRAGLYTAEYWSPPTMTGFVPWCFTTPNPLEIVLVAGEDGMPLPLEGANFGLKTEPCDPPNDDVVRLFDGSPDSIATDGFFLIDARVLASPGAADGDPPSTWFVEVEVGFSGCSPDHPFQLFAGNDFMDTEPPSTWLRLAHDDRGELCEAYWEITRVFDLTPLVRRYQAIFGPDREFNFDMELVGPRGNSFILRIP